MQPTAYSSKGDTALRPAAVMFTHLQEMPTAASTWHGNCWCYMPSVKGLSFLLNE
jgi:hypothetical protein